MRNLKFLFFISLISLLQAPLYAQDSTLTSTDTLSVVIAEDDPMVVAMDEQLQALLKDAYFCNTDTACLNIYGFEALEVPAYPDSVFKERLEKLDLQTPLDLRYTDHVQAFINLYVNKRRELSSRVLGMSDLYYPMIEEMLDKFDIPLEMKHLAIVESALNPQANSRAGAKGLWQFMYATGKMFDLNVSSYEDDRFDPLSATIAACSYLKFLHNLYGDWNLVLAAYNSGPGNVNKAIRRSGGHKDYWEIRRFLPRETRGYVPAFIAVNYMMNYHQEHNLYPIKPTFTYHETDTVHVYNRLTFEQVKTYTGVETEWLEMLNPVYKKHIIPAQANDPRVLRLPNTAIGVFLANQDSIHNYTPDPSQSTEPFVEEVTDYHRVRSGEFLGSIANRYGVRVQELMEWNGLRGTNIYPGQNLVVYRTITRDQNAAQKQPASNKQPVTAQQTEKEKPAEQSASDKQGEYRYHTVQSGDTLWDIAKKYHGVTVSQLKELNSGLNFNRLKPGQKIKIELIG